MDENTQNVLLFLIITVIILGIASLIYLEDYNEDALEKCQQECSFFQSDADLELECLLSCHEKFQMECFETGGKE